MRLAVEGQPGELAAAPGEALAALADAAESDGASRDDWLEKALHAHGATHREAVVDARPRHPEVGVLAARATDTYERAMVACREAVRERLDRAAREASVADLVASARRDG